MSERVKPLPTPTAAHGAATDGVPAVKGTAASGAAGAADVPSCMACDLTAGRRALPGGRVHETPRWVVEHCVGPLGLGTLIAKPVRHVLHVADLSADECSELGPLLRLLCAAVTDVRQAEQVYVCLWSHPDAVPAHLHFVVQPVARDTLDRWGKHGPSLQVAMFAEADLPAQRDVELVTDRVRAAIARHAAAQAG